MAELDVRLNKMQKATPEELQADIVAANRALAEISKESDRAAAVLVGAEIDNRLTQLLEAYFLPKSKRSTRLLEQDGPLGTFSSKIEIIYRIGFIPPEFHQDLQIVRNIRNDFAHKGAGLCFTDNRMRDLCNNLFCSSDMKAPSKDDSDAYNAYPRNRFLTSAGIILGHLTLLKYQVKTSPEHWRHFFRG